MKFKQQFWYGTISSPPYQTYQGPSDLLSSDHQVEIENRCQKKTLPDQRYCPFCVNDMKNEETFLVSCPLYDDLRGYYLRKPEMPDGMEFYALDTVSTPEQSTTLACYIVNAGQRRKKDLQIGG